MSLCGVVVYLTEQLKPHVDEKLKTALDEIARISEWKDKGALNRWENRGIDAIFAARPSDFWYLPDNQQKEQDSKAFLVAEILEFGRYNLYAAYVEKSTKEEYKILRQLFAEHGIQIKAVEEVDLAGW